MTSNTYCMPIVCLLIVTSSTGVVMVAHAQDDADECASTPCQNAGSCTDEVNGYSCICDAGYTDAQCQTDINECDSSPCQNGASCTDVVNGYICTCNAGYTDAQCQTDVDECDSSPCQNGASCTDVVNGYICTCDAGYTDAQCQTDVDECGSTPCQNGGICMDMVNGYMCTCNAGYTDAQCQTENVDECESGPCQNGGTCADETDGYSCTCVVGFTGTHCETGTPTPPPTMDLTIVVDNALTSLYIDGNRIPQWQLPNYAYWWVADVVQIPVDTRVIAVSAWDDSSIHRGVLASTTDDRFVTNASSWRCVPDDGSVPADWMNVDFDDSAWPPGVSTGSNEGRGYGISANATWIWTRRNVDGDVDVNVLCRGRPAYACGNTSAACDDVLNIDLWSAFYQVIYAQFSPEDGLNLLSSVCSNWSRCDDVSKSTSCSLSALHQQNSVTGCTYNSYWCSYFDTWLSAVHTLCTDNALLILANQQCYAANAATTTIDEFLNSTDCMHSHQLLLDLHNTISSSCGTTTAGTVTGLLAQFHSIMDLTRETDPCPSLLFPSENAVPEFIGPVYDDNAGYNSDQSPCTDFHFVCRVNYTRPAADDGARFDVSLTFDGRLAPTYKTTTSLLLDVFFASSDINGFFGTTVSCAVRSYWSQSPSAKTEFVHSSGSYYVGIKYWTDGNNPTRVAVVEYADLTPIYFQATVPIACPPCSVTVPVLRHTGLTLSSCSVTFTSSEPPLTIHTLGIRAVSTPGSNSRVATIYFDKAISSCGTSSWDEYVVKKIPVIVYDEVVSSSCSSSGDPHIRTFDGRYFNIYFPGDFVLWRSRASTFVDAHVRTRRCFNDWIACNCAVTFREGNNVVGINACGDGPPVVIRSLVDPDGPPAEVQTYNGGYSYVITMPSGRYLTAYVWGYGMDISVFAISQDFGRSEGLCGNFNGVPYDDTIPTGTSVQDPSSEPMDFCKSHMVNASYSLINGHIYFPPCYARETIMTPTECQCGSPDPINCAAVTATVGETTKAVVFNTLGTHGCTGGRRKRRETTSAADLGEYVITPDDLLPPVNITPPDAPLNPESHIGVGMREAEAHQHCEESLKQSAVYDQCINYTGDVVNKIIASCADDLRLTGNAETATSGILAKFNEACVRGIQQSDHRSIDEAVQVHNETQNETDTHTSIFQSPDIASVIQTLSEAMCPGQPECSGNGTCQDSRCVCDEDHVGADCSIEKDVPPTITGLRYGTVCDAGVNNCSQILLYVSGFSRSSTSACRVTSGTDIYFTTLTLASVFEVQCGLPMSPKDTQSTSPQYTWTVSVSNDNVTFSNQIELFVYDSKCLTCGNSSDSCTQKDAACLIDGKCYTAGESPTTDSCIACDPSRNGSSFTRDDSRLFCTSTTVTTSATTAPATTSGPTTPAATSATTASTTSKPVVPPPAPSKPKKKKKKVMAILKKMKKVVAKGRPKKKKAKSG